MADKIPDYSAWRGEILLPQAWPPLPAFSGGTEEVQAFSVFFWTRMLYSCLVDADFLDTEAFLQPDKAVLRGGYPSFEQLRAAFSAYMAEKTTTAEQSSVNAQRAKVLAACRQAALWDQGLFSLTVPTGGGKTLSSLAFAFDHAAKHGLRRIIYVIPYTSIIEQTANVFRKAFGPELAHAVIEHHSNVDEKLEKNPETADRNEDARTLAFENWDAPIIVTTSVQFFESLFAARSSRCRKLHRIAESIVVLDEAQTLPTPLFRPCLAAIKELSCMYKASLVLCTATQPEVGITPWNRNGLENVREIVPDVPSLFQTLERVTVEFVGALDMPVLAKRLADHGRALCIVNTRSQARDLYESLRDSQQGEKPVFHLSTWMCPAHRKAILRQVETMLKDPAKPPLLLVATSLIEAGVDQDWPVVYRAMAGVDSIAQAAGRCNREGTLPRGHTFVFDFPESSPGGEQERRKNAAAAVRRAELPFLSPQATSRYFGELHSIAGSTGLDKHDMLRRIREHAGRGLFPFRSVERDFRFIADYEVPLIIPYSVEAQAALKQLREGEADRSVYRRLQQWIVGVPEKCLRELLTRGVAEPVGFAGQHHVLTNTDIYSGLEGQDARMPALGLDMRNPVFRDVAGLILG
jgi:CRISPR-associated endonuclease/helicase Cas3